MFFYIFLLLPFYGTLILLWKKWNKRVVFLTAFIAFFISTLLSLKFNYYVNKIGYTLIENGEIDKFNLLHNANIIVGYVIPTTITLIVYFLLGNSTQKDKSTRLKGE